MKNIKSFKEFINEAKTFMPDEIPSKEFDNFIKAVKDLNYKLDSDKSIDLEKVLKPLDKIDDGIAEWIDLAVTDSNWKLSSYDYDSLEKSLNQDTKREGTEPRESIVNATFVLNKILKSF